MLKIGIIGIAAVFFAVLLKRDRPELSMLLSVACGTIIFAFALERLGTTIEFFKGLLSKLPVEPAFFVTMVKMLGIAYIAEFSSSICKDCGHSAIASQIELFVNSRDVVSDRADWRTVLICRKNIFIIIMLIVMFLPQDCVYASDTEITDTIEQQMLEKIDTSDVEKYSKDYLPDRLSFSDIVDALLDADQKAGEKICEYIYELFFYEIAAVKPVIINVLCYTILFMVFSRLIFWRQDYVYNVSFLFMYASVISMLMASFFVLSDVAKGCIDVLLTYLTALVPAYATVLLASGKGFSASGFYVLAFVLIYVVEWLIKLVLIPGIHLFLVLEVLNHVSSEKKLEKLAEFIESAVTKIMKASIKIVAGIGIVQAMIAPAKDKISESLILKSFQAIPGVGRLGQGAGEIMLGCAMLIKNSVGMAAIIVLFFIVLTPLVKTLVFSLMYRLLSAALQPVSDNRIVEGIDAVARAGNLYYIVIRDASILFFIVIAIVCASTSFMGG